MSDRTRIEWADATVNPIIGCSPVSPACDHCYAARMAHRGLVEDHRGLTMRTAPVWNGRVRWSEAGFKALAKLLTSRKPRRVFVGSMTDLFHERVPFEWLDKIFAVMALASRHTFCLLTKRPERMQEYVSALHGGRDLTFGRAMGGLNRLEICAAIDAGLPNVWCGVTVEDQQRADERIPILLDTPAAKRFVSCEPLLGAVDLAPWLPGSYECALTCGHREGASSLPDSRCVQCGFQGADTCEVWGDGDTQICPECGGSETEPVCPECGTYMVQEHPGTQYLDWVICGGETGPGARPMHPDWARGLRDQCQAAGVPFFMKKMSGGGQPPEDLLVREFPNANT